MPAEIVLAAVDERTAAAWDTVSAAWPRVRVHRGSILDAACDAVVSPANSFGFMDGGVDALYLEHFGSRIQTAVRERILYDHRGELLVGAAVTVPTGDPAIPWLIAAPTMRVPMRLPPDTVNPYLAMRAVLRAAAGTPSIRTVAVPGLGTGTGRVPPALCARQISAALAADEGLVELPRSWAEASERHQLLYTDEPIPLQY